MEKRNLSNKISTYFIATATSIAILASLCRVYNALDDAYSRRPRAERVLSSSDIQRDRNTRVVYDKSMHIQQGDESTVIVNREKEVINMAPDLDTITEGFEGVNSKLEEISATSCEQIKESFTKMTEEYELQINKLKDEMRKEREESEEKMEELCKDLTEERKEYGSQIDLLKKDIEERDEEHDRKVEEIKREIQRKISSSSPPPSAPTITYTPSPPRPASPPPQRQPYVAPVQRRDNGAYSDRYPIRPDSSSNSNGPALYNNYDRSNRPALYNNYDRSNRPALYNNYDRSSVEAFKEQHRQSMEAAREYWRSRGKGE